MKKWNPYLIALAVVLVVVFLLSVLKDIIIQSAIELTSPNIIGAKIEMDSLALGFFSHRIHIKNFRMYNPPGFPNQVFLVMPEVSLDADIPELLKGRMHFPSVVFNMEKMIIFKNAQGKLNVDSLKIIKEQQEANKGKPMHLPVFKIDLLDLNLGQVIMEDFTQTPTRVDVYNVGIKDQKIRNINGLPKLVATVVIDAIKPTAIRSAGLMAAEALMGVGFFPVAVVGVATAQDTAAGDINRSFKDVYQASLKMVHDLNGTVKKEDSQAGQITAKVYGADITFTIQDKGWGKSNVRIKARQYFLPKLEMANGLLYQLKERLK